MDKKVIQGVYSAFVSPINEDGGIRKDVLREVMDWQIQQGIQGFYLTGATGECGQMSEQARMELVETAINCGGGRVKNVVHIAAASMESAKRLAKQAKEAGADALSATPPPISAYDEDELLNYYAELSSVTSLPFLVYAQHYFKQSSLTGFFRRLMELPNLAGLKYTRSSYYEMNLLSRLNGGNINVVNGPDETLLCGLAMGADGGIGSTYNVMPGQFRHIYDAWKAGDLVEARKTQETVNDIITVVLRHGVIPTVKFMLTLHGFEVGYPEKPGRRFDEAEQKTIISELKSAGYYGLYPALKSI